jgi:hypothetical protein
VKTGEVHNYVMDRARTFAAAALLFASTPLAQAQTGLRVPDGQSVLFTARGAGVQIYVSRPSANVAGTFEWVLKAPDAVLLDAEGKKIGKHYGGPTWEANDGSKVAGTKLASLDSPKPGAVPWLLLKAAPAPQPGIMAGVTYVMRVDTSGGAHPSRPPHGPDDQSRVRYRATYIFFGSAR